MAAAIDSLKMTVQRLLSLHQAGHLPDTSLVQIISLQVFSGCCGYLLPFR